MVLADPYICCYCIMHELERFLSNFTCPCFAQMYRLHLHAICSRKNNQASTPYILRQRPNVSTYGTTHAWVCNFRIPHKKCVYWVKHRNTYHVSVYINVSNMCRWIANKTFWFWTVIFSTEVFSSLNNWVISYNVAPFQNIYSDKYGILS